MKYDNGGIKPVNRKLEREDLYNVRHAVAEATQHLTNADIAAISRWFGPLGPRGQMGPE